MSRRNWESLGLAAPALVLIAVLFLVPIVHVLWLSFSEPVIGLQNYAPLIDSEGFRNILYVTFKLCLITTVLCAVLGYLVSLSLVNASEQVRRIMFFLVLVPLWLSALVRAFAWLMILRQNGLVNTVVQSLALTSDPLPISYNQFAVLIGMVNFMLPYAILPIYANMRDIDGQLVRAARGLGASRTMAFWKVFFPLSLPGIIYAASLVFIIALGFYIVPFLLGGGRVTMIASYIAINMLETANWGLASMVAVVLLVLTLAVFGLSRWLLAIRARAT